MIERTIFKSATTSPRAVRDALAMLFTHEILQPSKELFLVEPWISNVVIFDNRVGEYDALSPDWGRRSVRLVEVLTTLAMRGTRLIVLTRPDQHNNRFREALLESLSDMGAKERCFIRSIADLHTKGILSESFSLTGSMNLTENGVSVNDEMVTISFDPAKIALARVHFDQYVDA